MSKIPYQYHYSYFDSKTGKIRERTMTRYRKNECLDKYYYEIAIMLSRKTSLMDICAKYGVSRFRLDQQFRDWGISYFVVRGLSVDVIVTMMKT